MVGGATALGAACSSSSGGSNNNPNMCVDPLANAQVADLTLHMHSVIIAASTLGATTDQTFSTTSSGTPAHTHMVTLTAAQLTTIKGGGSVTVTSTLVSNHMHSYQVSCHAITTDGSATDTAGDTGAGQDGAGSQ
jgi:hypothetical protein